MQQRQTRLPAMPEFGGDGMLFTLKTITYSPETPRLEEPFVVKGKVELFGIPFLAPLWVIAKVTAPETWWEHYIPIWGSPTVGEGQLALGGDFEITFPKGFDREGEFSLKVEVHLGPTFTLDSITLPPFPPLASEETVFIVAGDVPPEEAGFRNFRILSYSKNGGTPVMPPGVLELEVGDRCRVNVGFDHRYGAVTGKFHAAIWTPQSWDPHDEILSKEQSFSVPSSVDWESWDGSIDIIITSAISPGSEYGLYVKIMGITGGDIFTEYLANVITIVGPPPAADIRNFDFQLTKGTYNVGDAVPWIAPYEYVGPAQSGRLTISIGTGIYPTFNPVHTYAPVTINFEEALSWTARALQGNITLPSTLQPGQTYSVRAKLETITYPTQETDTDWSAFDVTPIGPPTSDIKNFDFQPQGGTYDPGDRVGYTAPYEYKGKAQGGWLTISLGTGVYPSFFTKYTYPRKAITFNEAIDWVSRQLSGSFTLPTTLESGQTYSVRAKLETADGKQETDTDWGVLTIREEEVVVAFSLSRPTAYPYRTPPGPVLITCPVTSQSTKSVTAQVKVIVYEGSFWGEPGTELWADTKTVTFAPGETKNIQFIRTSIVGTINRRDVGVEVRVGGQLIVQEDWDDVYYVEEAPPVGISFQMGIWGAPNDFPSYDYWMCWYWDNGIGGYVSDEQWYRPYQKIQFTNIKSGDNGYVGVFLRKNSTVSPQYTSPRFDAVDGGSFTYDVGINHIY